MTDTVQAEVIMSFVVSEELAFRIPVELDFASADPYAVRLTFDLPGDAPVTWAFGRELLLDGLSRRPVRVMYVSSRPPPSTSAMSTSAFKSAPSVRCSG